MTEPDGRASSSVEVLTVGCRLNQSESEETLRSLRARGVRTDTSDADLVVVNTCTVTADASRSSRKLIRKAAGSGARVVVTGCYAVAAPDTVAQMPGVVRVVPNKDKDALADAVAELSEPIAAASAPAPGHDMKQVRQAFKVQTGCDEACAFCIIPTTRGPLLSRGGDEIVAGIRAQAAAGATEVALTGVHLGKYGLDTTGSGRLAALVRRILAEVPELAWLRLSSIEARWIGDELLELIASEPRLCPHLHIPLQSGDDGVLAQMRRPYDAATYLDVVERVRSHLGDDVGISADVLVGFPGETDAAFANTCAVVRAAALTKLHVFRYSPREATAAAARTDQVDEDVKKQRSRALRRIGDELTLAFGRSFVGRRLETMVERATAAQDPAQASRPKLLGTGSNYLKVETSGPAGLVGRVVRVEIESASSAGVQGSLTGGFS